MLVFFSNVPKFKPLSKYGLGRYDCSAKDKIQANCEFFELGLLFYQFVSALARYEVISSLSAGLMILPLTFDKLLRFQIVKQRVKRSLAEGQDITASLFDSLAQFIAVHRPAGKNLQNNHWCNPLQ